MRCMHAGHPSESCYTGHGCRCLGCKRAHRIHQSLYREARMRRTGERMVDGRFTREPYKHAVQRPRGGTPS